MAGCEDFDRCKDPPFSSEKKQKNYQKNDSKDKVGEENELDNDNGDEQTWFLAFPLLDWAISTLDVFA